MTGERRSPSEGDGRASAIFNDEQTDHPQQVLARISSLHVDQGARRILHRGISIAAVDDDVGRAEAGKHGVDLGMRATYNHAMLWPREILGLVGEFLIVGDNVNEACSHAPILHARPFSINVRTCSHLAGAREGAAVHKAALDSIDYSGLDMHGDAFSA